MADADEDAIHPLGTHDPGAQVEHDLSDETQDFRFLNSLSSLVSDGGQPSLPRRGEKDFEPNPTILQADFLAASQQAMHNALAFPRLHNPKHRVIGVFAPDGPMPKRTAENHVIPAEESCSKSTSKRSSASEIGIAADACVYVPNPKGQHFRTMGQADRWNRVWLLPEEALYLLERGSLDIRWPLEGTSNDGQIESSIPMSLQAAYTLLIGRGELTLERFSVYSCLKRGGYTLIRAPDWNPTEDYMPCEPSEGRLGARRSGFVQFLVQLCRSVYDANQAATLATGPVIGLGIHHSYNDIYRRLSLIPYEDPTIPAHSARCTTPPFRLTYYVYKPSTPFRKSAPPSPDFQIAVVNARTQTTLPTLPQLRALLESTPLNPPQGEKMEKQLYIRLRHGYRSVILAVVDQGVISFLRFGDAGFSKATIYHDKSGPRGPKGGFPGRGGKGKGVRV